MEYAYPGLTYDSALPQSWVDACYQRGIQPVGHVVWAYPKGSFGGHPVPVSEEGIHLLGKLAAHI
jgi:hypothetical protein